MKTSLLTSVSLSVLCILSNAYALENGFNEHRLESLLANPKFKPNNLGNVLPGRYIIEFDEDYHGSSLEFVSDVESDILKSEPGLNSRIKMSIAQGYDSSSAIFRGVSIALVGDEDSSFDKRSDDSSLHIQSIHNVILRKILEQHRVKHVYPVTEIPRPNVEIMSPNLDAYAKGQDDIVITRTPKVDSPEGIPVLPFTHAMTQADEVHQKLRIKGKGIVVGVIDSGVDYRHPAFGGGFGPGYQVQYGYDLVGNRFDSKDHSSRRQNDTPLDTCESGNGHGTHVAGIIGANDKLFNFTGVAPGVTLGAWRVFGCDGSTSNDLVIKALIDAHEAGCDIINLSLGSASNWADDPTSLVANRISERGSVVIAAAGNDGGEGAFYISSPGSGTKVVATASIDSTYNLQQVALSEEGAEYPYSLSSSTKEFPSGELVFYSKGVSDKDACGEIQPDRDLTGKITLVQRGGCPFDEKTLNAEKYGAAGIVIYDNQEGAGFRPQALRSKLPLVAIGMQAGTELKYALTTNSKFEGKGIHLEFKTSLTPQKTPTGNKVSKFSSVGPLYDMSLKPDIAAPGGYIFSTLPIPNGGYGMLSGTSMASPYIAGAYALFMEAHGKNKSHDFLKERFQNYAKPATQIGNRLDNPAHQGAGLIQIYDTISQSVRVSPGAISFNDTTNIQPQKVTITNPSSDTVTYQIFNKQSLAIAPYNTTLQGYAPLSPPHYAPDRAVAELEFSKAEVTLKPGESTDVSIKVTNIGGSREPYSIYGGYVQFASSNPTLKDIHIPYVGVHGSVAELPIFDEGFPRVLVTNSTLTFEHNIDRKNRTTGFVIQRGSRVSNYVTSIFRLLTGTAQLITEVLNANMTPVGEFSQNPYLSRNTLAETDFIFTQRWNGTVMPVGTENLRDLVAVEPGIYFLRWKALKLMSDPSKSESWETHVSAPILIRK